MIRRGSGSLAAQDDGAESVRERGLPNQALSVYNFMMNNLLLKIRAGLLALVLAAAPAYSGTVVEYYNAGLDHYFITNYAPEIQALDSGSQRGWARTGLTFQTFDASASMFASSLPVCRFYGSPEYKLDSHFYSASPAECEDVQRKFPKEWLLEATDLFRVHPVDPNTGICPAGTKAVYRLYNRRADVNHRYTTEAAVVDSMIAKGYVLEGNGSPARPVAFCGANIAAPPPPAGAPVCTISQSSAIPVLGTPVTLTATCSGNPTTYSWINCTGTGKTCVVNATSPGTVNYAVVATNAVGSGAQASISLNWQYPASAAPVCQISASTITPQVGGVLTLTANCSQTPATFQWMGCSPLLVEMCNLLSECPGSSSTCRPIGAAAGAVHYAVRGVNSAGTSAKVGITVDWGGGAISPPPPSGNLPVCQLDVQPNTTAPAVGTTMTLTALCTGAPTSFEWSGSGCTTSNNVCTTTETSAGRRAYSVSGRNAYGVGAPVGVVLEWQQPGPPVCSVTASNDYPSINSTVTLTANCSQAPTSFQWTGCTSATSTCQATAATVGAVTYAVTATNAYGSGQGSKTVNWGTPPPVGADYCSQYANVNRVNLPWGSYVDSYQVGGFLADGVFVGVIDVPATFVGSVNVGLVEFIDGQARRIMSVSPSACDFRGFVPGVSLLTDPSGANYPIGWNHGINPEVTVPVRGGGRYYVNVRNVNFSDGSLSCSTSTCNMRITTRGQ